MKKFFDEIFKPYLFPLIMLFIGAYVKAGENLKGITKFFSESTNSFLKIFSRQYYVWEVMLYFLIAVILIRLYRYFFNNKSKKERSMIRATKRIQHEIPIDINGTNDSFLFKFDPKVIGGQYFIDNLRPYCKNCHSKPIRMTERPYSHSFRCNCGKEVSNDLVRNMKDRIITYLEENE